MRVFASIALVSSLIFPAVVRSQEAQVVAPRERLVLSAGAGSTVRQFVGMRLGAEYNLTRLDRVLGVRLHLSGFWTPSQTVSQPSILYGDGSRFIGFGQQSDLDVGVTASLAPWPRAHLTPYVLGGVAALEQWISGSGYYRRADGTIAAAAPLRNARGMFTAVVGAGLRARIGARLWQLELRELPGSQSAVSLGTAIRF